MNAPDRVLPKATTFAAALVAAQKQFAPALKTSSNPAFKSKYAALDACIEAVIDALNSNGFFLTQKPSVTAEFVSVETILIHESGEERSFGVFSIPVSKHDAHGTMSATTYCRRGGLMAAMGIAPEDDDANHAVKASPAPSQTDVANAISVLNAAAQKGSKAFENATKTMAEALKAAIPPQTKKDLYAAAKAMDEGVSA
jgi:hypothetical protein